MHNHELKLERATEHLRDLDVQVGDWLEVAYRYDAELDPQSGKKHIRMKVLNPPPERLRTIIGDCLHNLRSALDNLAYELAVAHQGGPLPEPYDRWSEFPVFGERPMSTDARKRKIGCIHPKAQVVIRRLQPYQRGERYTLHPLWQLHQLSNFDKHRLPHITLLANVAGSYFPDSPMRPSDLAVRLCPVEEGMVVASYTPPPDEPVNEVRTHFNFLDGLMFAQETTTPTRDVRSVLKSLLSYIGKDVVPPLTQYLPDPAWFNSVAQT
jgi:hypothetical protein